MLPLCHTADSEEMSWSFRLCRKYHVKHG